MEPETETGNEVRVYEEEELLLRTVPYIDNGYILQQLFDNSNAFAAQMLLELPLCKTNCRVRIADALTKLKKKRARLLRRKNADGGKYESFLSEQFIFPPLTENSRSKVWS